jgi:hypothetical protein
MWRLVLLVLAGCGRIGFGLGGDNTPGDGQGTDGTPTDGMVVDGMLPATDRGAVAVGSATGLGFTVDSAPIPHPAGSLMIAAVAWTGTGAVATVNDTAGNVYQPLTREAGPSGSVQLFFVNNGFSSASTVVTASLTGIAQSRRILVHQYPAVANAPDEATASGLAATQATTPTLGAITGSLIVAAIFTSDDVAFTAGPGMTLGATTEGDSMLSDGILVGTQASASFSWAPARDFAMAMAVFER